MVAIAVDHLCCTKLVWVVADAGYLDMARLLLCGAVVAAGKDPDSTSKLVLDDPFSSNSCTTVVSWEAVAAFPCL